MKKHYEKMCMTPLGFEPSGNLLQGSVQATTEVQTTGQLVESFDFNDPSFQQNWEDLP